MRLPLRSLTVTALLGALLATTGVPLAAPTLAVSAAEPLSGPCVAGDPASPTCSFQYGTVVFVADGDTIDVKIDRTPLAEDLGVTARIRLAGVQAMEMWTYSKYPDRRTGPCHGVEATASLESMTPIGRRVRLAAMNMTARSGERYRRSVAYALSDGTWQDVGTTQVQRGFGLWLPNKNEYAWNYRYSLWAQQAGKAGLQLWDTDACGYGPNQMSNIQIYARSDAEGVDGVDLNGEYVRIRNRNKSTPVDLSGWFVRDTMLRYAGAQAAVHPNPGFTFPSGTLLQPGQTITLYAGSGTNGDGNFYWGQTSSVFENQTNAPTYDGDGAYLFDPQGDLRYWTVWGCLTAELCADPAVGKVGITGLQSDAPGADDTNPNGEYVDVTVPATGSAVDLQGYQLVKFPYAYDFGPGSVLQPGETVRVYVGSGPSSRLVRYWGKPSGIFNNGGGKVTLENFRGTRLDCRAWGTASC